MCGGETDRGVGERRGCTAGRRRSGGHRAGPVPGAVQVRFTDVVGRGYRWASTCRAPARPGVAAGRPTRPPPPAPRASWDPQRALPGTAHTGRGHPPAAAGPRPPLTTPPPREPQLPPPKTLPARATAQPPREPPLPREPLPRSPEPPPTRQRPEPWDLPVPGLQSHSTCPQPTRPTRPGQPSRPGQPDPADPANLTRPTRPAVRRRSGRSSRWCGPAHRSRAPSRPRPAVRRSPPRA